MSDAQILISRAKFSHALSTLALALPRKRGPMDVRIDFNGSLVRMTTAGVEISVDGNGEWSGFVIAPLHILASLRSKMPDADPLSIRFENGRLFVQSWSIPATWHDLGSQPVRIPLNPPMLDLLQLKASITEEKLVSSGLRSAVRGAEDKAQKMMLRAQDILRPLGISLKDLEEILERKLRLPKD